MNGEQNPVPVSTDAEFPIRLALTEPVMDGDKQIVDLVLRKPKAKDFRAIRQTDRPFGLLFDLAAHLAGVPPSVIDQLCMEDAHRVMAITQRFLGDSPATGPT